MTRLKHLFQSAKISMATTCVGVGVVLEEEKVQKEQRNNLLALFFVQFLFLCHTAIFTLFEKIHLVEIQWMDTGYSKRN